MWILKGSFLGLWLFSFGTLAYLYLEIYRPLRPNSAVAVSVLASRTTWNPLWWAALVVCLVAGCLVTRSWAGKGWIWFSLMVTFLFPAGLLGLVLALTAKLRHAG